MLSGSEFHRVGAATEKARVPAFVITLGTESKSEPDDRSCLGCLAGVSIEWRQTDPARYVLLLFLCQGLR